MPYKEVIYPLNVCGMASMCQVLLVCGDIKRKHYHFPLRLQEPRAENTHPSFL